ncbi:hypothetical protein ACFOPQ_03680 [Deinococcus antarcticus]|uniref:Uncharacterized protein n=1 Tax=Deinococcus antarcticus TaxID=1298767 RepID=A0ABV8A356_9DEIO
MIYPPEQKPKAGKRTVKIQKRISDEEKEKRRWKRDPGGRGREIAREMRVRPGAFDPGLTPAQ